MSPVIGVDEEFVLAQLGRLTIENMLLRRRVSELEAKLTVETNDGR